MKIETRVFGEIEVEEDKIINFEEGIIGFVDCKNFTLIYDEEREGENKLCWLQSIEEPVFALPVLNPLLVKEDYDPKVETELLKPVGELSPENTFILVTVTVPENMEELSVNLRAPIIINTETRKACQVIVDDKYPIKYNVYDILKPKKAGD